MRCWIAAMSCCCLAGCAVAPRTSILSPEDVQKVVGAEVGRLLSPENLEVTVAAMVEEQSAGRDIFNFDQVTLWIMSGGLAGASLFYPLGWRPLMVKRRQRRQEDKLRKDIALLVSDAVERKGQRHASNSRQEQKSISKGDAP